MPASREALRRASRKHYYKHHAKELERNRIWRENNRELISQKAKEKRRLKALATDRPPSVREIARSEGLRSGYERTLVMQMRKAGTKFEYEPVKLPYVLHHNYVPDFYLPKQNIYIEAKGKLTPEDRKKMIAVKSQHPDLDIRMVFMNGQNKLSRRSNTTYLQWAEKHGFPAADGVIPEEWLV